MRNNLYWPVYKNLEDEFISLSNMIHIDDEQLQVYSIKISELLLRSVVEIESISKELFFANGGTKTDDKDLFFDTDCLDLLEEKWKLSNKQVFVSASNLFLEFNENTALAPLKKANKRGTSSSDWLRAYQAIKHNRVKNLKKGNFKHLIRSLAGLYILNIYYKGLSYSLDKDAAGTNFDNRLGSELFSVKLHINQGISEGTDFAKNSDFEECIYILEPTDETRKSVQNALKIINEKVNEKINMNLTGELNKRFSGFKVNNQTNIQEKLKDIVKKIKSDYMVEVAKENGTLLKNAFEGLKYEAVLNKNQY